MGATDSTVDTYDSKVGEAAVGNGGVLALLTLFIGYSALLVYAAMAFWPPVLPVATDPTVPPPATTTTFLGQSVTIAREQNLILLVGILGSLGGMAYVLRSFAKYVGQRRLRWSWVATYVASPFLGGVMATIVYILLRAGLIGGTGSIEGNTWGFAAVATLVGLFNMQTASKLKDVFEVLLASSDGGRKDRDQLEAASSEADAASNGNGKTAEAKAGNGSTAGDAAAELAVLATGMTDDSGGVGVTAGGAGDGAGVDPVASGSMANGNQSVDVDASSDDVG